MSYLKRVWLNCLIHGLVKVPINLLKSEPPFQEKNNWIGTWRLISTVQRDDFIYCLKKGQPSEAGREKLNSQLSVLVDKSDAVNQFIFSSDEEDADAEMNVIEDVTDEEIIM